MIAFYQYRMFRLWGVAKSKHEFHQGKSSDSSLAKMLQIYQIVSNEKVI
jgi:hypothetical protein